jgi:hypothetical protein
LENPKVWMEEIREIGSRNVDYIELTQNEFQWWVSITYAMNIENNG